MTGLLRCDCGWQGAVLTQKNGGQSFVIVPEEGGLCAAEQQADGTIVIQLRLGPCRIEPFDIGIHVNHERGHLFYAPTGQLTAATGIFVTEHLRAPRPPPCECGSFHTEWVDGPEGHAYLTDYAERLGRKVAPIRCQGEIWLSIEGFGGRAARCLTCGAKGTFPTICEEETEWVKEMEAKRQTVFVSYGGPDEEFAARLVHALTQKGVKTWFFPKDAVPGEKLHRTMFKGINEHDRTLLICSQASLSRPGVLNEIERVLEREGREGGTSRILPITLDKYVFQEWAPSRPDLAQQLRDRVICDFSEAVVDGWVFNERIEHLVRALER